MTASDTASRRSVVASFFATAAAAVSGLFTAGAHAQSPDTALVKKTSTDGRPAGGDPPLFSSWVTYGNLVFIAGKGHHEAGDITVHTTSVLDQLEAELKKAGSSMDKVLKVNVYLHDLKDYDGMNAVFKGRFGPNPPVRTTIAAYGGVPGNSLVEIDCIAAK
jgi:enamine deaminase RidA (YjgF/YER057c/UK114 family)